MQGNKICVNNITYTHKNLDCLPAGVTLEDAKMISVKGEIAFNSEHAWASNFFPCKIELEGIMFHSAEHAYQYTRAIKLNELNLAKMIARAKSGKAAKMLASHVESNEAWDKLKINVMRTIVSEKFMQNGHLCDKLVGSGQVNLIEATLDGFWGARASITSKSIKQGTWTGANFLGKILAEMCDELRRELGLPELKVPNATTPLETETLPAPPSAMAATPTPANAASNQSQQTASSLGPKQTGTEPTAPQNRNSRKNKEHQSPIKSPETSLINDKKKKKAHVFSPKSALPPRSEVFDLFSSLSSGPDLSETATKV